MSDNDENLEERTPETPSPYRSEPAGEKMPDFSADGPAVAANAPIPATRDTRERAEDDIFGGLPAEKDTAAPSDAPRWQPAPAEAGESTSETKAADPDEALPTVPVMTPELPNEEPEATSSAPAGESAASEETPAAPARETTRTDDEEAEASPLTSRRERRAAEDDLESTQVRRSSLFAPTSETDETVAGGALLGGSAVVAGDAVMNDSPATAQLPANDSYGDDDLFAGEELEAPRSRAWAHVASIFGLLLLTPIAWYLIADAGARFTLPDQAPWTTGHISVPAILELVAGLIIVVLIAILVRSSSVGAWITGVILIAAGVMFVVTPELTQRLIDQPLQQLSDLHTMGRNIAHHFVADGSTGRLLTYGVALLLAGYISHSARRAGRREERLQAAYERRGQGR